MGHLVSQGHSMHCLHVPSDSFEGKTPCLYTHAFIMFLLHGSQRKEQGSLWFSRGGPGPWEIIRARVGVGREKEDAQQGS